MLAWLAATFGMVERHRMSGANGVVTHAENLEEPSDQPYGDRRYGAVDPEGHSWFFARHVGAS